MAFVNLMQLAYPVGSIYCTVNSSVDPAQTFGGTWTKITNCFLYGTETSSEVGTTGGSQSLSILKENLPSHIHNVMVEIDSGKTQITTGAANRLVYDWTSSEGSYQYDITTYYGNGPDWGDDTKTAMTVPLPPHVKVYMWKRTA